MTKQEVIDRVTELVSDSSEDFPDFALELLLISVGRRFRKPELKVA